MVSSKTKKYIAPLYMNGLNGRMLRLPAKGGANKELLLIYGHHASLERMFGLAEVLNKYGTVTMPDLPGFGGMESFYKIERKPTIDNYADYLAAFIKLRYGRSRRRFTIVAMSFSVPLLVRMLQKYPDIAKKVDGLVSIAGFVHREDFIFTKAEYWGLRVMSKIFSFRVPAFFMKTIMLRAPFVKFTYRSVQNRHKKLKDAESKSELEKRIEFEIYLWQVNDLRTRMYTMELMLTVDLCHQRVDVPIFNVTAKADRYLNSQIVEQHMRVIFDKFEEIPSSMANHAPTIIADADAAAPYVPKRLREILGRA